MNNHRIASGSNAIIRCQTSYTNPRIICPTVIATISTPRPCILTVCSLSPSILLEEYANNLLIYIETGPNFCDPGSGAMPGVVIVGHPKLPLCGVLVRSIDMMLLQEGIGKM